MNHRSARRVARRQRAVGINSLTGEVCRKQELSRINRLDGRLLEFWRTETGSRAGFCSGRFDPDVLRFYDDLYENDYLFLVILIMALMIANIHVLFFLGFVAVSIIFMFFICSSWSFVHNGLC